jgi:glycyl-tRNA synthetase
MREFTQAELQIFFDPASLETHPRFSEVRNVKLCLLPSGKNVAEMACSEAVKKLKLPEFYVYHMAKVQEFYLGVLSVDRKKLRFRELGEEERAFYNKLHWDVEVELAGVGFKEIAGVHYRTDHDLKAHEQASGQSMAVDAGGKKIVPHVLELSFGVDRNIYSLLDLSLAVEKDRAVLRFPRQLSPFDAAVFPLVSRDGLEDKAAAVQRLLKENGFVTFYDGSGSIGRRYRRMDEIGVAACVTVDYDSLKSSDVTLRDRDSMAQVRVGLAGLPDALRRFLAGERLETLGKRAT